MLTSLVTVFGEVLGMFGTMVTALFGTDGQLASLLPYFLIGIAASLILLAARVIRKFVWGN